jgi:hypothetical protein
LLLYSDVGNLFEDEITVDNDETDVSSPSDEEYVPLPKKTKGKRGQGRGGDRADLVFGSKGVKMITVEAKILVVVQQLVLLLNKIIKIMMTPTKIMFFPSFLHLANQIFIFPILFLEVH